MKLRLLLLKNCNRACPGCCNKGWNLDELPKVENYFNYKEIMFTGGEPMIKPELVIETAMKVRRQTNAPLYMYTAKVDNIVETLAVLNAVDGMTLTLHEQKDVEHFEKLNRILIILGIKKNLRLNVFKGVELPGPIYTLWKIKDNMEWIKDCPLPDGEEFRRL